MTVAILFFQPWSSASAAITASCQGPTLVIDRGATAPWIAALDHVEARLRRNDDLDRCAEIAITSAGDEMTVRVVTFDGRRAERQVTSPVELLPTVEALVALPPIDIPVREKPGRNELPEFDERIERTPRLPIDASAHLELGGGPLARIAGGPLYGSAGVGGFAQLVLDRWLIEISGRWEAVGDLVTSASPADFNMQTFAVGVGVGWRAAIGNSATVDAVVGPEILVEIQDAEGVADELGGTASDVRLDLLLRLSTPRSSRLRFFCTADVDGSPVRFNQVKRIDKGMPSLPAFSGGFHIGAMWGAR